MLSTERLTLAQDFESALSCYQILVSAVEAGSSAGSDCCNALTAPVVLAVAQFFAKQSESDLDPAQAITMTQYSIKVFSLLQKLHQKNMAVCIQLFLPIFAKALLILPDVPESVAVKSQIASSLLIIAQSDATVFKKAMQIIPPQERILLERILRIKVPKSNVQMRNSSAPAISLKSF